MGSEMCIRDRTNPEPPKTVTSFVSFLIALALSIFDPETNQFCYVSHTFLKAYKTRLGLSKCAEVFVNKSKGVGKAN